MIYIAGSSKEQSAVEVLSSAIAAMGFETLHSWTNLDNENLPMEESIWQMCSAQIRKADVLLVLVPTDHEMRGCVWEAGYASGRGIPVIVFDPRGFMKGTWHHAPNTLYFRDTADLFQTLREWLR